MASYDDGTHNEIYSKQSEEVVNYLIQKYENTPKPSTINELVDENPELKSELRRLGNQSYWLFGMTLKKYFLMVGILELDRHLNKPESLVVRKAISDAALNTLTSLYSEESSREYGTFEDAVECLKGMKVKQTRWGQICISKALNPEAVVKIPYGINSISQGAFAGQKNIRELNISALLTEIPERAFYDCASLEHVEIPEGVVFIGISAFEKCSTLKSVLLPKSLKFIYGKAFADCTLLETVEFQNPEVMVSVDAFAGCPFVYEPYEKSVKADIKSFDYTKDKKGNITIRKYKGKQETVIIPGMIEGYPVTAIDYGAFRNNAEIVEVSMSDHVTSLRKGAFQGCINLQRIHLSNHISTIYTTCFEGCIGLKEINIPDSVEELSKATFKDMHIEKIHIGKGLVSLDSRVFRTGKYNDWLRDIMNTLSIKEITIDPNNPHMKVVDSMLVSKDGKTLFTELGDKETISIPEGVETIHEYAFSRHFNLKEINLPDSLVTVEKRALSYTGIKKIVFGNNVRKISVDAFLNCPHLSLVRLNEGIESIESGAFRRCPIRSVQLPESLAFMGESVFDASFNGINVQLFVDESNPHIKNDGRAIYIISETGMILKKAQTLNYLQVHESKVKHCSEYYVKAGTTHINRGAFSECWGLRTVILPEGLISIGNYAFNLCPQLMSVSMPEGVVSIGERAFGYCSSLESIVLPNSIESIGEGAFEESSISEFVLGSLVKEIGPGAFFSGRAWDEKQILNSITVDTDNKTFFVADNTLFKRKPDGSCAVVVHFGHERVVEINGNISEICSRAFERCEAREIRIPESVTIIGKRAFSEHTKLIYT